MLGDLIFSYLPELFQRTFSPNEISTEQKIEEVLSLFDEVIHQGYIPAQLQVISSLPKYLSWIDSKNNTVFHHIVLYSEKAYPRARQSFVDVAEMILESISQETRMALLQNKNNDKKTPFEFAFDRDLGDLMDKFLIHNVLDMEKSKVDENNNILSSNSPAVEVEHSKPSSHTYNLRKAQKFTKEENCNCCR